MRPTQTRVLALSVLVVAAAACRSKGGSEPAPEQPRVTVSFTGEVDAGAGTVSIWTDQPAASGARLALLQEIPVVQDGKPGVGPADTVELVTEGVQTIAGGCGAVDGYEAAIRLRSFYAGAVLTNAYVEITSLTPTGREACNSSEPYETLSNQFGLWSYGTIGRDGSGFNDALRAWRFRLPDTTRFVFRGHVVADLVTADPNPPTTIAVPGAGTYGAGTSVELSCTDAETGCAATYYTTDGSEPTRSSPVYSGPIPVASSLTLRFFSVDYWGNAEAVQSADYVLDDTAPYVVSTDPADGDTGVPPSALVEITFSEPMDTAITPGAIALDGPDGPVAGTVTWDGEGRAFTFAPAAPLAAETSYTLSIQPSARDVAGNQLADMYTASFTTRALVEQVSGHGSATLEPGGIAFDGSGNGLAVWRTSAQKVVYACYSATTGTWSPAALLEAASGTVYHAPRVAAGPRGFVVAWFNRGIKASVFTDCTPGAIARLDNGYYGYTLAVGANDTGFMVAWAGTDVSYAAVFEGGAWTRRVFTWHEYLTTIAIAGEGAAGYRIVYVASSNAYAVRLAGEEWSDPLALGAATAAAIASDGTTTCIAWHEMTTVSARVEVNGSATTSTPIASKGPSGGGQSLSMAMNGGRCQVVVATEYGAWGALYDGASWQPAASLGLGAKSTAVGVTSWGASDFAAIALVGGDLWVNRTQAGAWGTPGLVESSSETVRVPYIAAESSSVAQVLFAQVGAVGDAVWLVAYDGASASSPEAISMPVSDGKSSGVKMAATANGDALAIWTQEHQGRNNNVFWALRQGGTWGPAQLLATDAQAAAVASNGTDFMVAYRAAVSAYYHPLVARRFLGGAFGGPATLASAYQETTSEGLVSDGEGYALAYVTKFTTSIRAWAQIYDGTSWGSPTALSPNRVDDVSIAGRPGEYLAAWVDQNGSTISVRSWRAVGSGASWAWETSSKTVLASGAGNLAVALAAGPGGFAAAYPAGSGVAAAFMSGGTWSPSTTLRSEIASFDIASNGTTYLVATSPSSTSAQMQIHAWDGSWRAARDVGFGLGSGMTLASDGATYGLLVSDWSPKFLFVSVPDPISGPIDPPIRLDTAGATLDKSPPLVATPSGYLAAWTQQDPADPTIARIYARGGL